MVQASRIRRESVSVGEVLSVKMIRGSHAGSHSVTNKVGLYLRGRQPTQLQVP